MDSSNQEYIRSYWNNDLTEIEREAFEQKCADDQSFASSVAQFMQLKQIAKEAEKDRLKALYQNDKKASRNRFLLLIAGLIVIGLFIFRMFFFTNDSVENQEPVKEELIFAMLVEEHQDANRGDNDLNNETYTNWFAEEKYDTLIAALATLDLTKATYVNELIWTSQSLYQVGDNTKIIKQINDYLSNNTNDISRKDELLWLQTLAYLKVNDVAKAKSNLEQILSDYRLYQDEASELLKSLE